jgi:hypothetical protein
MGTAGAVANRKTAQTLGGRGLHFEVGNLRCDGRARLKSAKKCLQPIFRTLYVNFDAVSCIQNPTCQLVGGG